PSWLINTALSMQFENWALGYSEDGCPLFFNIISDTHIISAVADYLTRLQFAFLTEKCCVGV
ncbi:hypothetical protein, partial [Gallaecimonas pentaromativorans]|uniref:hypothetical protein n=1 Tax=Gallaecimonas pentaromativorans TaxID=584787 RepID=UPI003A937E37